MNGGTVRVPPGGGARSGEGARDQRIRDRRTRNRPRAPGYRPGYYDQIESELLGATA